MEWTGGGSIIGKGWTEVSLALWHMRSDLEVGRATIHPTLQEADTVQEDSRVAPLPQQKRRYRWVSPFLWFGENCDARNQLFPKI